MSTYPDTIAVSGGSWSSPTFNFVRIDNNTQFRYRKSDDADGTTDIYFDITDHKWYDGSDGGQPSGFWNETEDPDGLDAGNPSVPCFQGNTIKMTDGGASGNRGSFIHPFFSIGSNPTVTWLQGYSGAGVRDLQVQYTADGSQISVVTEYHTANPTITHWTGTHVAGTSVTQIFKVNTNVYTDDFDLIDSSGSRLNEDSFTPTTVIQPDITPTWGAVNSDGTFTVSFASAMSDMYFDTQHGDEIEIIEVGGSQVASVMLDNNQTWDGFNGILVQGFGPTDYSPKTFKIRLKNSQYGSTTFHDFNWNTENKTSHEYISPYTAPQLTYGSVSYNVTASNEFTATFEATNPTNTDEVFAIVRVDTGDVTNRTVTVQANSTTQQYSIDYIGATSGIEYGVKHGTNWLTNTHTHSYTPGPLPTITNIQWNEDGAGATGNTVTVSFHVENQTSNDAQFDLRNNEYGQPVKDTDTVNVGQSKTVTLSNSNAGQNMYHRVYSVLNTGNIDGGFTTAALAPEEDDPVEEEEDDPPPESEPVPPEIITKPSEGGIKRYPLILTQLFNKRRSFYSIGLTHKDGQLNCFI